MSEPITMAEVRYGYAGQGKTAPVRNFRISVNGGPLRDFRIEAAETPTPVARYLDALDGLADYLIRGKT